MNTLNKALKVYNKTSFDFRKFACPEDEFHYMFDNWVEYYKMKYSICKAIKPKNILETGIRYGYSAITFLKAAPRANYLGIENSPSFRGSYRGINWAREITNGYSTEYILADTKEIKCFPGEFYDFINLHMQSDGDITFHELEMSLEKGKYILVDGYFGSNEHMLSSTYFLKKYNKFVEYSIMIPTFKGELLIKTKEQANNMFTGAVKKYTFLKGNYDSEYYLTDCGGFDSFTKSNGKELDVRLGAVYTITNPQKGDYILDIGCGRGELTYALSQACTKVIGVDYSNDAIEIARKTYSKSIGERLEFIETDILKYNPGIKFDKIVASDVIEHIERDKLLEVFRRISLMLKDNGYFVLHTAPNALYYKYAYNKKRNLTRLIGLYLPKNPRTYYEDLMHINEQTPAQLHRSLKKVFSYCSTWVLNSINDKKLTISDYKNASSIFAYASNCFIEKKSILSLFNQEKLKHEDIKLRISSKIINLILSSSKTLQVPIILSNFSGVRLSSFQPYPINISYHWINKDGQFYEFDGIRTSLNIPLMSHEAREIKVDVCSPKVSGEYILQITLVQEGCFWFESISEQFGIKIPVQVN